MNRLLLGLATLTLLSATPAHAQRAALTGYSGWKFGGSTPTQAGDLNTAASMHYGLELAIRATREASGILMVDYQPTTLRLDAGTVNAELHDIDAWYFMAGGEVEVPSDTPVIPFAIATVGMAWFNPPGDRDGESAFAGMFGGGARFPLGQDSRVELRIEGRMYLTIPWGGASLYCGSGGCHTSVGGRIGPVQGSALAGFRVGLGPRL